MLFYDRLDAGEINAGIFNVPLVKRISGDVSQCPDSHQLFPAFPGIGLRDIGTEVMNESGNIVAGERSAFGASDLKNDVRRFFLSLAMSSLVWGREVLQ